MASSTSADAAYALLTELLKEGLVGPFVTYFDVAAATLFVYDYLITLPMEVELVWGSQWNYVKILFILQRYLPFFDTCFLGIYRELAVLTVSQCEKIPYFTGFLYMVGFCLSEMLLSVRVWALWNRNKRLSIALPILFLMIWAPGFYAMYAYVISLRYAEAPLPGFRGCFVIAAKEYVIWSWAGLLAWNSVTLILTLYHGLRSYRLGITSRLGTIIYRDGAYYYIYLFIFSMLNIFFTTTLQPAKRVIILSLERCLHSMFASRVLLHMRAQARRPSEEAMELDSAQSHIPIIGSIKTQNLSIDVESGRFSHIRSLSYETRDLEKHGKL